MENHSHTFGCVRVITTRNALQATHGNARVPNYN